MSTSNEELGRYTSRRYEEGWRDEGADSRASQICESGHVMRGCETPAATNLTCVSLQLLLFVTLSVIIMLSCFHVCFPILAPPCRRFYMQNNQWKVIVRGYQSKSPCLLTGMGQATVMENYIAVTLFNIFFYLLG